MSIFSFIKKHFITDVKNKRTLKKQRRQIFANVNSKFFTSIESNVYHKRDCKYLDSIETSKLMAFENIPSEGIYKACKLCFADEIIESKAFYYASLKKNNHSYKEKTKAEIMEKEIQLLCIEFGININFNNGAAYVQSDKGTWIFLYNDRPIQLMFRGASNKEEIQDEIFVDKKYLKDKKFPSPLHVIQYICANDEMSYYLDNKIYQ